MKHASLDLQAEDAANLLDAALADVCVGCGDPGTTKTADDGARVCDECFLTYNLKLEREPLPPGGGTSYVAVRPFAVASKGSGETCYASDLEKFDDRSKAIRHGFETLEAEDDFLIVTLNEAGEIKAVGWMEEDRPGDTAGLDAELIAIGYYLDLEVVS